jgi:hypothetical protein
VVAVVAAEVVAPPPFSALVVCCFWSTTTFMVGWGEKKYGLVVWGRESKNCLILGCGGHRSPSVSSSI